MFSNRHQQYWKCLCLLLLAFLIIVGGGQNSDPQEVFLRITPVTMVWALIRVSGAFDNSVEDETIFSEQSPSTLPPLRFLFQERIMRSWVPVWQLITTTASSRCYSTVSSGTGARRTTSTPILLRPRYHSSVKIGTSKVVGMTKC